MLHQQPPSLTSPSRPGVCVCVCVSTRTLSCVWLFATLWTVVHQALLSMGLSQARILEWIAISYSRGPFQSRMELASPASPALQVDSLLLSHLRSPDLVCRKKWWTQLAQPEAWLIGGRGRQGSCLTVTFWAEITERQSCPWGPFERANP